MAYYTEFDRNFCRASRPICGENGGQFKSYHGEKLELLGIFPLPPKRKPKTAKDKKDRVLFHFENVAKGYDGYPKMQLVVLTLKELKQRIQHYKRIGKNTDKLDAAKRIANRDYLHCRAA